MKKIALAIIASLLLAGGIALYIFWSWPSPSILATLTGHKREIHTLVIAPDAEVIASGGQGGVIRLWDLVKRRELARLNLPKGEELSVLSIAFAPNGKVLATGDDSGAVHLWDVGKGKVLFQVNRDKDPIVSISFSPNGEIMVTGSRQGTVVIWDVQAQRELSSLTMPQVLGYTGMSRDGRKLISGGEKGQIVLLELKIRGKIDKLASWKGHEGRVHQVVFSPDGQYAASAGSDGLVKLWQVSNQKLLAEFHHSSQGSVQSLLFSPQGHFLATGGSDQTIHIWDVTNRRDLAVLTGHSGPITGLAFSQDGKILISASGDHTIKLWEFSKSLEQ